jgi:hypothetical protein
VLSKKIGQSVMACRYDVAFDTNVFGAKHVCAFAKKCVKLKMLLHVSTGAKPYMFCALFLTVYIILNCEKFFFLEQLMLLVNKRD